MHGEIYIRNIIWAFIVSWRMMRIWVVLFAWEMEKQKKEKNSNKDLTEMNWLECCKNGHMWKFSLEAFRKKSRRESVKLFS